MATYCGVNIIIEGLSYLCDLASRLLVARGLLVAWSNCALLDPCCAFAKFFAFRGPRLHSVVDIIKTDTCGSYGKGFTEIQTRAPLWSVSFVAF